MKRRRKVRWYPYPMLGLGVVFFLLAIAELYFDKPPSVSYLFNRSTGIYGSNHTGYTFAVAILLGSLFMGIGIYALRNHKD
jgi:hypothetical protein